jgi:ribosome maturation factor RimP
LLTRQLQQVLEVEGADYARLEVSSPGLDRPLKKVADWHRFVGSEVNVTLRMPFQGRKHWKGVLTCRDGGGWRLEMPPSAPPKGKPGAARKVAPPTVADTVQALDFELEEVREARLVPLVDFKGRKAGASPAPAEARG